VEFTNDGPETIRIDAELTLDTMRASGLRHFLMPGDNVPLGWFAVKQVPQKPTSLDAPGAGRAIEVDIACKRTVRRARKVTWLRC
jgi:phage protein U